MVFLIRRDQETDNYLFGNGPCAPKSRLSWISSDNEEQFEQNQRDPRKRRMLEQAGWTSTSIRYHINDRGFRMDRDMRDLEPGNGILYLGCSLTFGVGLNIEDTWAHLHHQKQGGDFINLAWPATGIDTQYRMLAAWAGVLRPPRAYTLGAFPERRELIRPDGIARFGPWTNGRDAEIYHMMIEDDREVRMTFLRAVDAMRAICCDHGIELYAPGDGVMGMVNQPQGGQDERLARDLMHRGPAWHQRMASIAGDQWQRLA